MLSKTRRLTTLCLSVLLILPLNATAATPWTAAAVPGGIARVELPVSDKPPVVHYQGKRVMVLKFDGGWQAIIGIPLTASPGKHVLTGSNGSEVAFQVTDKRYREQYITLPPTARNKRYVNPNAIDLKRIRREKKEILAAFAAWRDIDNVPLDFNLPVNGPVSSPFGLRRFFNKQPRKPHSGLDIAAPQGTVIRAPAAGTVIRTGNYFFNGKTVLIDHGQGLVTMYCHMNSIETEEGQSLAAGQAFGTVGKTGRVTGPHLHWSVSLNEARIDPAVLLHDTRALAQQ